MQDDYPGKIIRTYKMPSPNQFSGSTPSSKDNDGTFYFVGDSEFEILDRIHTFCVIHT